MKKYSGFGVFLCYAMFAVPVCAALNTKDADGNTPLHKAVLACDSQEVQRLLAMRADPNIQDAQNHTPLHYACLTRQPKLVEVLYAAGADDPRLTRDKLESIRDEFPEIVDCLYRSGLAFQYNIRVFCELSDEENPLTPLSVAMFPGFGAIIKEYVGEANGMYGHSLQTRITEILGFADSQKQAQCLFDACGDGDVGKVVEMLYLGVDVNDWVDRFGRTFLQAAVSADNSDNHSANCREIITLLLDNGADVDGQNQSGNAALHYAVRRSRKLVRLLLSYSATVDIKGLDGNTPLNVAVMGIGHEYDYKMVRLLLESRASIAIEDDFGRSPLKNAQMFGPRNMVLLLQSYRAGRGIKRVGREHCIVS